MSASVCIAVYASNPSEVAAIRVHGVYGSVAEAQAASRALAMEQVDVQAYVVDSCNRWIPVRNVELRDAAEDTEEIPAPENTDPSGGRMGSVCDVRRTAQPNVTVEGPSADSAPPGVSIPRRRDHAAEQKETHRQRTQLEALLRAPVPPPAKNAADYAGQREMHATLCAFGRRLTALYTEGLSKCRTSADEIRELSERHPEYRETYREKYVQALRESGMRPEDVAFMRFLRDPPTEN